MTIKQGTKLLFLLAAWSLFCAQGAWTREPNARFKSLMEKIEKGETVKKTELEWAKGNIEAGLAGKKVLLVVTSHDQLGNTGHKTGYWMEELAVPYTIFRKGGLSVDIASPKGGEPPVDPNSLANLSDETKAFLADEEAKRKLKDTLKLGEIKASHDAYFVVGGHGVLWDLAQSQALQKLLSDGFEGGRIVAAVCHGPAGLVNVRLKSGDPLVKGRKVSGFSNEEEKAAQLDSVVPFALEPKLRELGGKYESGTMWRPFAVRDGRLVTGQNPASSGLVAQKVLEALRDEISKKLESAKTE